jgi:hypothetical protein
LITLWDATTPHRSIWNQHRSARPLLTAIMHHEGRFCVLVGGARVGDPSGWIGVRQLAVQRVWG